MVCLPYLHAHAVLDHEPCEPFAVDEYEPCSYGLGKLNRATREPTGGDEHALRCLVSVEGAQESLDLGSQHCRVGRVSLCLDVDARESKGEVAFPE